MGKILRVEGPFEVDAGRDTKSSDMTCTFGIQMSDGVLNMLVLEADRRIPKRNSSLPQYPGVFLQKWRFKQSKEVPNYVRMECNYSDKSEGDEQGQKESPEFEPDPTKQDLIVTGDTHRINEVAETDTDGKPITTTAGEALILEESRSYRALFCQKHITRIDPRLVVGDEDTGYLDFVNKDTVKLIGFVFPAETLWATDIKFSEVKFYNRKAYRTLSWALYANPKKWTRKVRNAGFHECVYRKDVQGKTTAFLEPILIGSPPRSPSSPVPLDPSGRAVRRKDQQGIERIITSETRGQAIGLDAKFWNDNLLKFWLKQRVNFRGLFPLT